MGMKSRRKGASFEREVVAFHRNLGLAAERIPLSGAAKGSFAGDLRLGPWTVECKRRADGFRELYSWLAHDNADLLVLRADRQDLLVVLNQTTWLQLLRLAGLLPTVPGGEAIAVNPAQGDI
jgi:hypothetical protein